MREGHHQIREAHHEVAGPAAQVARGNADEQSDRDRHAVGHEADDERSACAEQHAGKQIAAERIGPERESAAGRHGRAFQGQPVEHLLVGIKGREDRRAERRDDHEDDDQQAEQRRRLRPSSLRIRISLPRSGFRGRPPGAPPVVRWACAGAWRRCARGRRPARRRSAGRP